MLAKVVTSPKYSSRNDTQKLEFSRQNVLRIIEGNKRQGNIFTLCCNYMQRTAIEGLNSMNRFQDTLAEKPA